MKKKLQVLGIIAVAAMIGLGFTACQDPEPPPAPVISITTQPVPEVNVTAGSITGTLFVAASVTQNAAPSFQWFSNTTASNVGGTIIPGATGLTFTIPANPTNLAARTYFFFVEVRANGAEPIRSRVARVNVTAASATVTAVTVNPSTASVARGQSRQFSATVSGTNNPAQTVNWSVTGSNNSGTNINLNSGLLTVAGDESATSLTVTATSTVDTNKSGTAVVTVAAPTVTSVEVYPSTASVARGQTRQFTATVSGTGNPAQTVNWSVTGGGNGTNIDVASGLLTVAANESATSLTVTATSTVDTNRSGTAVVTVAAPTVTSVEVSPSTASVIRGETQQFSATVSGTGNPAQTVTWTVEGSVSNGTNIDVASGLLTVAANETATSLTVTATSTVDTSVSGTATVTILVPVINITTQPTATTIVTAGSISGSLTVEASVTQGVLPTFQWFSNTTASSVGGIAIIGATSENFTISTNLATGTHYFFVEVRASGAEPTLSNVAAVTVERATPNYTVPTARQAVFGQTLSEITLPTGWAWVNPTASVGEIGTHQHNAVYTPINANFYSVTRLVTVNVKDPRDFTISFADFHRIEPIIGPTFSLLGSPGTISVSNLGQYETGSIRWRFEGNIVHTGETPLILNANIHGNQTGTFFVTVEVGLNGRTYSQTVAFTVTL